MLVTIRETHPRRYFRRAPDTVSVPSIAQGLEHVPFHGAAPIAKSLGLFAAKQGKHLDSADERRNKRTKELKCECTHESRNERKNKRASE